jgi:7,8-dihydropterin-6-yl-methyl-4-(beta-D-ribofuranosyl)aminobenzene 5'-phosphate synthase
MKIITLIENSKPEGSPLEARFGLGLYVETNGIRLLFDNGPDETFVHNAALLGIDLADIDYYVLSHAHYDHGGGLRTFLRINKKATVYVSEYAMDQCYSMGKSPEPRYIGLDEKLFSDFSGRFHFVAGNASIQKDLHLYAVKDFGTFRPKFNSLLYVKKNETLIHDNFRHELVMAITENGENTVFAGCAHSGILNMIATVREQMPGIPVKALIGGFHLLNTATKTLGETPETVQQIAREIEKQGIRKIYTGHCTGEEGFTELQSVLGNRIEALFTGKRFEL